MLPIDWHPGYSYSIPKRHQDQVKNHIRRYALDERKHSRPWHNIRVNDKHNCFAVPVDFNIL